MKSKIKKVKPYHYRHAGNKGGRLAPLILDLGTRCGCVISVTLRPRFTPGERNPGTHRIRGCVHLRADLDTEVRAEVPKLL
jgi:hypothetical protein